MTDHETVSIDKKRDMKKHSKLQADASAEPYDFYYFYSRPEQKNDNAPQLNFSTDANRKP